MMDTKLGIALVVVLAVLLIGSQAVYTVDQREQALLLQLGQPVGDVKKPGLHFKLPLVQDVRRFDRRILAVDPQPTQMVISSTLASIDKNIEAPAQEISGEPIIVNTFARYRIDDPLMFMKTLRTINGANQRLESIMNDATRNVLGRRTLRELLSPERTAVMADIRQRVNETIKDDQLGIEIVDIRIIRADLTPELRQSTVRRMISELQERATETRAKGEEQALEIRSTAEKERTVILAQADRDAQILRGEGDQESIKIYADAYSKDTEFYRFLRSLEAYSATLANPETRLILKPDSAFFRYFGDPDGQ